MTRRCAVFGCNKSDSETLHSFPKDKESAKEWKESLKLQEFPIELLQTRFGVCNKHFTHSDFENDDLEIGNRKTLKAAAIPSLEKNDEISSKQLDSCTSVEESIETVRILEPTSANIALLEPPSTSKYRTLSMECNMSIDSNRFSTSGNTDISILTTHYADDDHEDYYDNVAEGNRFTSEGLQHSIDSQDFTVVSCELEESTEILRFHTIKPQSQNGYSGTDSDIEVLMSEEINDTEWSAALENLENNALETGVKRDDCSIEAILAHSMEEDMATPASPSQKRQGSVTDHDCSIEEFSRQSSFDGTGLTREQLVNVVREQRVRIRDLESTLARYRLAQNALFDHVEAIRQEFATSVSTNMDKSYVTLAD